ncbi:FAD-dependent oxidoreductase [Orenia marismortui]|uniref:NADPH-dependent 2,4-dienoyl-CoA reductase/sulfur reductase-like enzyme n=1 Tax=Orenia marismortui TaxID=46469 RepID=A0A4R8GYQ7_9FIRM|nr:FAD-dependent oxidoreductase [Orenia marismortui]TDX49059.1 NADPH-dependent 2,4-dienoyl-CoA reductase/sulfur reductase-like enzyme [Orenia marismortui]
MKIAVIGCTHAGTAAIVNAAKLYPEAEITVYERNDNISFLSCGIALYVGGVVKDVEGLFYSSPEELAKLGVRTKMGHDVLDVDIDNKKLKVRNLDTKEEFEDNFDRLIITTGSWPIIPNLEGIDLENIVLSKNFYHANDIIEKAQDAQNVVVVGAGYIGVELVESFERNGKNVTLIDMEDRILSKYLDQEYTAVAEEEFKKHDVTLALGERVNKFAGKDGKVSKVITDQNEYEADLVIMCIGFKPNTELFKGQIDMLDDGSIIVDNYMRTSNKDVLAAGDCCAVRYNPTGEHRYIPLATNAVRMGTLVARNLKQETTKYMGTQGTSGIKIYQHNIAATGLTEEAAQEAGLEVSTVTVTDNYRPEFMPTYDEAKLKVVYETDSRRIVGAQIMSETDLTQSINTMSVVIQNKMTVDELAFVDFFFQPHFNKPWNLLNMAGLNAE